MKHSNYEKSLIPYKKSIISLIKNFFRKIFKNSKNDEKYIVKIEKSNFIEELKFELNYNIYDLQKKIENKEIYEEELTDEEIEDLKKLYINQIYNLKNNIEKYKNDIVKIKS